FVAVRYELTPGVHRIKWQYSKDGSVNTGSDAVWIDNVFLPAVPDSDGDGIVDGWEYEYLDSLDYDSETDGDSDGISDYLEILHNTDREDNNSYPVALTSSPVTEAGVGQRYQYALTSNFASASFEIVQAPLAMTLLDGRLQWLPGADDYGEFDVVVRASVEGVPSIEQAYTLTVYPLDGDVDGSGSVTIKDLLLQQDFALGAKTPTPSQLYRGDLYPPAAPDGKIDASDLLLLERHVLGGQ
ncbi:dockerin type I repeat-containing protein, partial [Sinobacterium caligoides]|uniref:dockerin type I repeat-containing protein n=1 Tax=Sinobacterium caligoides TaxID=933926 RepID=UPI001B8719D7